MSWASSVPLRLDPAHTLDLQFWVFCISVAKKVYFMHVLLKACLSGAVEAPGSRQSTSLSPPWSTRGSHASCIMEVQETDCYSSRVPRRTHHIHTLSTMTDCNMCITWINGTHWAWVSAGTNLDTSEAQIRFTPASELLPWLCGISLFAFILYSGSPWARTRLKKEYLPTVGLASSRHTRRLWRESAVCVCIYFHPYPTMVVGIVTEWWGNRGIL